MFFKRAVQRYGRTPIPETPFQRAGQLWDERIGSARVQARNWRLMAFGSFGLTTALSGGLLWQSLQSRVVPYVVEVDRLGEPRAVAPAEAGVQPTDAQVAWFLGRFVTCVRSISLDPVLMRQDWLSAYNFATRRGAVFLDAYARAADPFGHVGERTVSVQISSVVRASDRTYQVKWVETAYDRGALAGTTHWTAMLTVVIAAPSSADQLRRNPLGLYVDAVDWSRELEPSEPAQPRSQPIPAPTRPQPDKPLDLNVAQPLEARP